MQLFVVDPEGRQIVIVGQVEVLSAAAGQPLARARLKASSRAL